MSEQPVSMRAWPWPYRAMMALCSDLDETPDRDVYWETARFLNTTEPTAMGRGVGLEVGNTMYFDMPGDQFSYWNTDDGGRAMIHALIRSGHIDCLHSFGDHADTREHAQRALQALQAAGCRLEVWVDHAVAPSNFGPDIMHGHGDVPGDRAYHADLSRAHGIRFVWRGRVTSVIGQDVAPQLRSVWNPQHPGTSLKTAAKELAKHACGRFGGHKYAMHPANRTLRRSTLRDGQAIFEFMRCNPHWGGVSVGDTARNIAEVLTENMLRRLVQRQGACILYTHLGKIHSRNRPLGREAVQALRQLAVARDSGCIGVWSTARLLRYLAMRDMVRWSSRCRDDAMVIDVQLDQPQWLSTWRPVEELLGGLTFEVPSDVECTITLNGRPLMSKVQRHVGSAERAMLSVMDQPLVFPNAVCGERFGAALRPAGSATS